MVASNKFNSTESGFPGVVLQIEFQENNSEQEKWMYF